jgi:hypothetical protein
MTTLYLHIGNHRTATTSIQGFMLANWEALVARGVLHPMRVGRHFALFNAIFAGRRSVKEVAEDLLARVQKQRAPIHSVILSDEDVCMRTDLTPLQEFSAYFDVKVVFALRRQDLWLESWYLQNIKWQWNKSLAHCTLAEFLARQQEFHWAYYDRLLRHCDRVFGQANVLPYVFEPAQMLDGPVAAFCHRIGLTDLSGLAPPAHVNSSYSPSVAEFVRLLPLDEAPEKYRGRLETAIKQVDRGMEQQPGQRATLLMDYRTRMDIIALHAPGNAAVARRYFGRDQLFTEPLPTLDAPLAQMVLPQDSTVLMQDYVAPMVRGLIKQFMDATTKT